MSTELTLHAPSALVGWAAEADAAYRVAERLVVTAFAPDSFRGKPVEATAALLAGAEVGLAPLAALRSFDIIQGVAAPRALALRAIAQRAGVEFNTVEESESKVTMRARRSNGLIYTEWETVTWTIDRAKQMGLTSKANWQKMPQHMLVARCTAELARRLAADAILGLGYSVEELDDTPGEPVKVSRATARATKPEPPAPAAPEPITDAQSKKLHALTGDLDLDRDAKLALCARVLGHDVTTTGDLSKDDARRVIDALEAEARDLDPDYVEGEGVPGPGPAGSKALEAIKHHADRAGWTREALLHYASTLAGRDITAATDLAAPEAQTLLEHVASQPDAGSGAEKVKAAVRAAREEES